MYILILVLYFCGVVISVLFFFSSRRRHTRSKRDWSSDVCSSDLGFFCFIFVYLIVRLPQKVSRVLGTSVVRLTIGLLLLFFFNVFGGYIGLHVRSEERRVGKECRFWWERDAGMKDEKVGEEMNRL